MTRLSPLMLLLGVLAAGAQADPVAAGRTAYAAGNYNQAITEFKRALAAKPADAEVQLWLGRALGRKAENANPLRAAFLVGDVRNAFERAVQLAPDNLEARSDLLEFYLEAPGALGGGMDKAQAQAAEIGRRSVPEGHAAGARIAEKKKDLATAEREWKSAAAADPNGPGRWNDLGHFYDRQHRWPESEAAFRKAGDAASGYYLAEQFLKRGQKLEEAASLAGRFVEAAKPSPGHEPTVAHGHLLLGRIYARLNKKAEAQKSLRAALEANPHLEEARKDLERLR